MSFEELTPEQMKEAGFEVDANGAVELSDAELDEIAGGAAAATKPCPICSNTMTLKGAAGHNIYYCKFCKKLFKA